MIKIFKKISFKSLWAKFERVIKGGLLVLTFIASAVAVYHQFGGKSEPQKLEITIEIKMPEPASKVQDGKVKGFGEFLDSLPVKPHMDGNSIQAFMGSPKLS